MPLRWIRRGTLVVLLMIGLVAGWTRPMMAEAQPGAAGKLAAEIVRLLRADARFIDVALNPDDPAQLYLSRASGAGGRIRVDVSNLLHRIADLPRSDAKRVIAQFVDTLAAGQATRGLDLSRIFANVRPRGYLHQDGQDLSDILVFEELAGDLIVLYQVDEPGALRTLNRSELGGLGMEELRQAARRNLEARLRDVVERQIGSDVSFFVIESEPLLSPALLLSDWFEGYAARRFPGGYLIGLPNRDFVILFNKQNPRSLQAARQFVNDFTQDGGDLSSPLLFEMRDGRLAVFDEAGAHTADAQSP